MLIIEDKVIITQDVLRQHFVCQLESCKGACCWEGDYGAPLEAEELDILEAIYPTVRPFLSEEGIAAIEQDGTYSYVSESKGYATTLIENQACAFMTVNENGIAQCGIEQAHKAGLIDFKKPISCHLYPIRVKKLAMHDALNYDRWDVCSAACDNGEKLSVPLYKFVKDALIRRYGADFYEQLEAAAEYYLKE